MTLTMKTVGIWILTILPAVIFVFAGAGKLMDPEMAFSRFEDWGYPGWMSMVIGVVEVVCGVLLLVPKTVALAALVLGINMIGAALTHIKADEMSMLPLPLTLFAMLGVIEYVHRKELQETFHLRSNPRPGKA